MTNPKIDWKAEIAKCDKLAPGIRREWKQFPFELQARLCTVTNWFAETERRLSRSAAIDGGAIQRETLSIAAELERHYREDGGHGALETVLHEDSVPRILLMEYLDGINLITVRSYYRDRVQYGQLARTRAIVPGGVFLTLAGAPPDSPSLKPLGHAWTMIGTLKSISGELDQGRIQIPGQDLELHGVTAEQLGGRTLTPSIRALVAAWLDEASGLLDTVQTSDFGQLAPAGDHVVAGLREHIARLGSDPALVFATAPPPPRGLLDKIRKVFK